MGSPTWSRLKVSRDLELKNKATNTGLGLGLVAEMNLVELGLVAEMNLMELGLVADICCRWTRIGVMEVDMWYMDAVMSTVVDGSSDDDGGVWQR